LADLGDDRIPGPSRRLGAVLGIILLTLLAPRAQAATESTLKAVSLGQPPPDFIFDDGSGPTRLSALSGTKAVVINFWATWCPPCLDELKLFERASHDYGARVRFVTFSNEKPGVARDYLKEHHLRVPLAEDTSSTIFKTYTIEEIPVTVVIKRGGAVSFLSVGELDADEFHRAIEAALAQ
jgi:peroxiredoxin